MASQDRGRFCQNCKKTVIDFSNLSDQELYQFFSKTDSIPCGRFHNDQLNKVILPLKQKRNSWTNLYKVIAAGIAFFSLKFSDASTGKTKAGITMSPSLKKHIAVGGDKIIISGTVKDE